MKSYKSKITLPSKSVPGVTFTIRRMSDARRAAFRESIVAHLLTIRVAMAEAKRLDADPEPDQKTLAQLSLDIDDASAAIRRAWFRSGFLSVEGIEIDDKPASQESMIADGPVDLFEEIVDAIRWASELSGQEAGESGPPSISGGQADVQTNNSSAATAESTENLKTETAGEPIPATKT